jgi:phage terminase large subunit-like protein
VTARYLREQVASALGMPAVEGLTKRLNFCLWTTSETAWLPPEVWCRGAGRIDPAALRGLECYGGLDVASKIDVAAFVLAFPNHPTTGKLALQCRFWIPEATAESRQRADNIPWRVWAREGWVTLTPGDVIDPDAIEEAVLQAHMDHCLVEVATDPWNAASISAHLQGQGVKVVEFGQTLRNFNEPSKEFQSRLKQGNILHGSNPVLDWMASNVAVWSDRSGNIRPVKPKPNSPKKVDGILAAVMALGRIIVAGDDDAGGFEAW